MTKRRIVTSKAHLSGRLAIRRGLDEREAAIYLSLSPSFFRRLVDRGLMPRPRIAGKRRIWDIDELDVAFKALPKDDEPFEADREMADSWSDYS